MAVSAAVKYYVLAALGIVLAILQFLAVNPELTEASLIALAILVVTMVIHDIESPPQIAPAQTAH
jgi:uncharacterized membrane-anchored protein